MPIAPGTRLGPYEITSAIGSGGMGEVYRAVDTRLERDVAVKILPSDFAANAQLRLRFQREARLISSLTHPHICTLHDVGETDGISYVVMELLEGETLADRLARGPLPMAQLLSYAMQLASALEKAHRQGIVHRDLKPGNIMITKSGVKLLDFGLAKSAAALVTAASPVDATQQKPLTAEGTIVGTFQYMAPEQLEGADADPRSDLFALGAVMYEMATGKRAFEGKTRTSLIAAIVQGQPKPVSELQPLTPPALERLIGACLAKDPDDRVQTAHDVLLQLQWIAESRSDTSAAAPAAAHRKRRPWLIAAAAVLAAALLGVAAGRTLTRHDDRPYYSFTVPSVTPDYRYIATVVISPDGTKIAFNARDPQGTPYVWVQPLDSFGLRRLDATRNGQVLCWSPDSRYVFFASGGALSRVSVESGAAQSISAGNATGGADMSDDGVLIVAPAESPLMRVDAATGRREAITTLDRNRHEFTHQGPRFLPGGKRFLFVARTTAPASGAPLLRLYAGSLDGRETRFIGEVTSTVAYAEPGYLLYVREGALMARPFDAGELRFTGEPRMILDAVAQTVTTGVFSVSRNGVLVARPPRRPFTLRRVDGSGRIIGQIGNPETMGHVRVAPDGERVAVALADVKAGTFDIWALGITRPTQERIVSHGAHDQAPVWSGDGSRFFFSSDRLGLSDIFVAPADGSGSVRAVVAGAGTQTPTDVSPDGSLLIYSSTSEGGFAGSDLYVVPVAGGVPRPFVVAPGTQGDARFSPNGRLVAYLSNEAGLVEVYVRPYPGPGRARQISTVGVERPPLWSRDGKTLYFTHLRSVYRLTVDPDTGVPAGEPEQLFELPYEIGNWDLAADGTFIISLSTEERATPPLRVVDRWQRLLGD